MLLKLFELFDSSGLKVFIINLDFLLVFKSTIPFCLVICVHNNPLRKCRLLWVFYINGRHNTTIRIYNCMWQTKIFDRYLMIFIINVKIMIVYESILEMQEW